VGYATGRAGRAGSSRVSGLTRTSNERAGGKCNKPTNILVFENLR
jgi:hypothetical protein